MRNEYDIYAISKNLKILRKRKNMTQQALADELGIGRKTIISWEKGALTEKGLPSLPDGSVMLMELCKTLDCDVDFLFGKIDTPKQETYDICKLTGLSEEAADKLISWGYVKEGINTTMKNPYIQLLNDIIPRLTLSMAMDYNSLKSIMGRKNKTIDFHTTEDFENYKKWAQQYPERVDLTPDQSRRYFIAQISEGFKEILKEVYSDET